MNKRIRSISHTVYWLFLAFSEWASSRLMGERSLSYAANERAHSVVLGAESLEVSYRVQLRALEERQGSGAGSAKASWRTRKRLEREEQWKGSRKAKVQF